MIVLELEQPMPRAWEGAEYYVPSHVSPERVQRAYVGFSSWHDVHDYLQPAEETQRWYALEPGARDAQGRPTTLTIRTVDVVRDDELEERWALGPVIYRSPEADAATHARVRAEHPLLAPTLDAALAQAQAQR